MSNPENNTPDKPGFFARDRNKVIALAVGTVAIIGTSFGVQAIANSRIYQHAQLAISEEGGAKMFHRAGWGGHGGWGHRGWGHRGHRMRFSEMSDTEIEQKVTRLVKHAAIEIDATDEQTAKIATLVTALAKSMKPVHADMHAAGQQLREILTAETVDREALEKLRSGRIAEIDRLSKDVANAAADVAETLTAKQRKIVNERIEEMKSWRKRWRRG